MRLIVIFVILFALAAVGTTALWPRIARAAMLTVGAPAPDFHSQVVSAEGTAPVNLGDFHGRVLVLYFYPKDDTYGCTKEACAFRDSYAHFLAAGISVLGCSIDTEKSHAAFIRKYHLPFPLLLDPGHKIAKAYGADNGIPILGLDRRVTYVISRDGRILKVYPDVDPVTQARQILHDLGADHPPTPAPPAPSATASAPVASTAVQPPPPKRPQARPRASRPNRGAEPRGSEQGSGGEWKRVPEQPPQGPKDEDIE